MQAGDERSSPDEKPRKANSEIHPLLERIMEGGQGQRRPHRPVEPSG